MIKYSILLFRHRDLIEYKTFSKAKLVYERK